MRRFQRFFYDVLNTVEELNINKNVVKNTIGDSTNNNRTLTVNQVIRFLEGSRRTRLLAKQLRVVYETLRSDIVAYRDDTCTFRTDAIDINEFINIYREVVMDKGLLRREVGNLISRV